MVQLSHSYMTTRKTTALTTWTFAGKVMSLLFNMLSRFVTAFLQRSEHLSIPWLQSLSAVILELKKIKSVTASTFPHVFAMKWWDQMPVTSSRGKDQELVCWGQESGTPLLSVQVGAGHSAKDLKGGAHEVWEIRTRRRMLQRQGEHLDNSRAAWLSQQDQAQLLLP